MQRTDRLDELINRAVFSLRMGSGQGIARASEAVVHGPIPVAPSGDSPEASLAALVDHLGEGIPKIPNDRIGVALRLAVGLATQPSSIRRGLVAGLRRSLANQSWGASWLHQFADTLPSPTYRDYGHWLEGRLGANSTALDERLSHGGAEALMSRAGVWRYRNRAPAPIAGAFDHGRGCFRLLGFSAPFRPVQIRKGLPLDWRGYLDGRGIDDQAVIEFRHAAIGAGISTAVFVRYEGAWHVRSLQLPRADRNASDWLMANASRLAREWRLDQLAGSRDGGQDDNLNRSPRTDPVP